jgi:aminoglycoside phosphotransferase (APT) family kinase protein
MADASLEALADVLGGLPADVTAVPWGDSASTFRVRLVDGDVLAVRRLQGPRATRLADGLVRRAGELHRAGVPVAQPAASRISRDGSAWVVTPWIDGVTGASVLGDPRLSLHLAEAMGRLTARLGELDGAGLDLDDTWCDPAGLTEMRHGWLDRLGPHVQPSVVSRVRAAAARVEAAWGTRAGWGCGVVHGDFAPINVILRPDGSIAVVDLADLRLGPRLADVAWWGWVVRYHHAEAWHRTWSSFVAAAGLPAGARFDELATAFARLQVVERAARADDPATRTTWLTRLVETADW